MTTNNLLDLDFINNHNNHNIAENEYYNYRQQYGANEFISPNLFTLIMKHQFSTSALLLKYNDNHFVYKLTIKDLLGASVKNWEYNRPPDLVRCNDIAQHIYNSKAQIDTMLFLSWNNSKEVFEVIDGIHRLTALRIIRKENAKPIDFLDTNVTIFGSNNNATWLYDQNILCNIRFNATEGQLVEAFKNLNKCQSVPNLYIRDPASEKRQIIDGIVSEWMTKYKKNFSSSANPNVPNTNRNRFVELLDKVFDLYNKEDDCTIELLRTKLNNMNDKAKTMIPFKTTIDARAKCIETGCYLFLFKNDKLEEMFNQDLI